MDCWFNWLIMIDWLPGMILSWMSVMGTIQTSVRTKKKLTNVRPFFHIVFFSQERLIPNWLNAAKNHFFNCHTINKTRKYGQYIMERNYCQYSSEMRPGPYAFNRAVPFPISCLKIVSYTFSFVDIYFFKCFRKY